MCEAQINRLVVKMGKMGEWARVRVSAVVCLLRLNGGRPPALSVFLEPLGALSFHPPPRHRLIRPR